MANKSDTEYMVADDYKGVIHVGKEVLVAGSILTNAQVEKLDLDSFINDGTIIKKESTGSSSASSEGQKAVSKMKEAELIEELKSLAVEADESMTVKELRKALEEARSKAEDSGGGA